MRILGELDIRNVGNEIRGSGCGFESRMSLHKFVTGAASDCLGLGEIEATSAKVIAQILPRVTTIGTASATTSVHRDATIALR